MTTLDGYKNYLINYYRWPIDNNDKSKKERETNLLNRYPDQYLQKIIDDTYSFIKDIFDSDTIKDGYCIFDANENSSSSINLSIRGGGPSDTIYIDLEDRNISKHLLKQVFGKYFSIELRTDEIEYEADDDIVGIRCEYFLYMQGFPNNIDEIKKELFGESKVVLCPVFKTKEQEELFARCAKETMFKYMNEEKQKVLKK